MKKKLLFSALAIVTGLILFFPVPSTFAQSSALQQGTQGAAGGAAGAVQTPPTSIVPTQGTGPTLTGASEPEYTFCDLLSVLVRIAGLIIAFSGALALLFFIIGAMLLISSSGSSQRVEKGKSYIKNSVIGLVVIMLSYSLVGVFLTSLIGGGHFQGGAWVLSAEENSISSDCAVSPIITKMQSQ